MIQYTIRDGNTYTTQKSGNDVIVTVYKEQITLAGAGDFTINGKTFETEADKTVFKLDDAGNVCEIVTDTLILGDNTYQTSNNFRGFLNLAGGSVESMRYFIGTISGKLGGVKLIDLTITTDDEFTRPATSIKKSASARRSATSCSRIRAT